MITIAMIVMITPRLPPLLRLRLPLPLLPLMSMDAAITADIVAVISKWQIVEEFG